MTVERESSAEFLCQTRRVHRFISAATGIQTNETKLITCMDRTTFTERQIDLCGTFKKQRKKNLFTCSRM